MQTGSSYYPGLMVLLPAWVATVMKQIKSGDVNQRAPYGPAALVPRILVARRVNSIAQKRATTGPLIKGGISGNSEAKWEVEHGPLRIYSINKYVWLSFYRSGGHN